MQPITTIREATAAFNALRQFIGARQIEAMANVCRTPEKKFMFDKLAELLNIINTMPKTYETEELGKNATVYLHYFTAGADRYVTEKDMMPEQLQAFGAANFGHGAEMGYISIKEIIRNGAELDLFWTPKTLGECM